MPNESLLVPLCRCTGMHKLSLDSLVNLTVTFKMTAGELLNQMNDPDTGKGKIKQNHSF